VPIALEITLILVLALLAAGLVPLLFQLRRTARGLDAFLLASSKDLAQIAGDVHASRLRMDHLAGSLQSSVDELISIFQAVGEAGRSLKSYHSRFLGTIDWASRNLGSVIGGISGVLAFFKRSKPFHQTEPEKRP
jgi:hypothetical protein